MPRTHDDPNVLDIWRFAVPTTAPDQRAEILAMLMSGPARSDVLTSRWPRAQARIHELSAEWDIRSHRCPETGLAIYVLHGRLPRARGKHDLGLRVTWTYGTTPQAKSYSAGSLSGTIPDAVAEEATQAAQEAVRAVLVAHGYLTTPDAVAEQPEPTQGPGELTPEWLDELLARVSG